MRQGLNRLLDRASEFIADRKGLLPLLGMVFVALNFVLGVLGMGWLAESDLFLHLGIMLAILGFLLAWAL
jgi:hypothetical protein